MCRAGKDKTKRYCPATTNEEKIRERNARRRLSYHKSTLGKLIDKATADGILTEEEISQIGLKAERAGYKHHVDYVHGVIDKLRSTGKETHLQHAKPTSNGDLVWDIDRARIHREIIQEQLAKWENVPCNAEAIFSGGLGGAGKSSVLKSKNLANIDLSQYATLNPDDIKEVLAEKGLIPQIDGLTPMEASPLVHEEASWICSQLARIVISRKKNVIYDITMASYSSTKKKVDNLANSGYNKIDAIFVDISPETSDNRAASRHLNGHNRYLKGTGFGGRVLPKGLTAAQVPNDPDKYRSLNAEIFVQLKEEGVFSSAKAFDNDVDGRTPIELESLQKNYDLAS